MISMMTNESSGQILLLLTCLLSVSTELICPDTGFIDSSAQMSCTGGTISHDYINPSGRNVAQCLLTGEPCDVDRNMFTSVLNATHTTLTIGRVQLSDAGTWKCVTGSGEATCHLSVASIPARQITSPRDTSSLRIGEDLLLNISISRYYCSDNAPLLLMMGKIDITLFNGTVNETTKEYFVVKQRMTASHFGIVKLFFECGNFRQALLCEGVQLLSLEYDDSFRSDETGSTAAIVMGIVIIVIIVIIVLLIVKKLRNKNDGFKGCIIFQVETRTVSTSTDDLIKVPEKTFPAENPKPEVHENPMPAEDPKLEVHENPMAAEDPKLEVHENPMPAEDQKLEVHENPVPAGDPKLEIFEITIPAEDPKPEVHENTMPAGDPKPEVPENPMAAEDPKLEVHENTMPAGDPKPEIFEITIPAEDPKPEIPEITPPAEDPKPEEIHSKTSSSNESTI